MGNFAHAMTQLIMVLLMLGMIGYANAEEKPESTLNAQERAAVLGEIKEMVKTDENLVEEFVVKEATAERITRFFALPDIAQHPQVIRENALIFAGKGKLLSFDKPSDIINKVSAWFPQEVAAARAKQELSYFSYVHLYGPYPSWNDEAASFVTLWNCMPNLTRGVQPTQNPFAAEFQRSFPFMSLTDWQSGQFDFGRCVREDSSRRHPSIIKNGQLLADLDPQVYAQEKLAMGKRVAPILQAKFAQFLAAQRCTRQGADDCVLNLLMWSSLSPDDVKLAHALQNLETDIAPDSPLPALQTPSAQNPQGYEARFDEYLRRNAFLRAKLASVLSAKQAWGEDSLSATLQQITQLREQYSAALAGIKEAWRVNDIYEIGYRNKEINPYALAQIPALQAAILAHLTRLDQAAKCRAVLDWVWGDSTLQTALLLHASTPLKCVSPDWHEMRQVNTPQMQALRNRYLEIFKQPEPRDGGAQRDIALTQLTDRTYYCFEPMGIANAADWKRELCQHYISEPQVVSYKLKHSPYQLNQATRFEHAQLAGIPQPAAQGILSPQQDVWLMSLVRGMDAAVVQQMQAFAAELRAREVVIQTAALWWHPQHQTALIALGGYGILTISPQRLRRIDVPVRFGQTGGLIQVSDLDHDGSLELWFGSAKRACRNDETDVGRDLYCIPNTAEMGELYGDSLSYFADTPQPHTAQAYSSPILKNVQPIVEPAREENQQCNSVLLAPVLSKKLNIDFGGGDEPNNRGAVLALVCKPHPLHPEQTIAALFYDLPSTKNENDLEQKGFALAILDMATKKVLRLYTDNIEEDASIRISGSSLYIDTARYNLAAGVRALGVRMNIGYGPRCAEGGENNYLSLFIEEGKQLRPVFKDLAMSAWRITEGSNGCGYGENPKYTQDEVGYSLSLADSMSEGWHDLELTAHHASSVYGGSAPDAPEPAPKLSSEVIGTLRAKNKYYVLDRKPVQP